MSDSHDYNKQFEQANQGPPYGSQPGPGAPPPGPPPQPMAYAPIQGRKSQALAGILSGIFPGLGNIYVGFYTRGFVQVGAFILSIVMLSSNPGEGTEVLFGLFMGFWWFFSIIDAVRCAGAYNRALQGGEALPDMPTHLSIPSEGSKTWGLALMVIGLIFFLNTKFDFSMEWMEEWWPMFLVGFGAWLYWKARQGEKERLKAD